MGLKHPLIKPLRAFLAERDEESPGGLDERWFCDSGVGLTALRCWKCCGIGSQVDRRGVCHPPNPLSDIYEKMNEMGRCGFSGLALRR